MEPSVEVEESSLSLSVELLELSELTVLSSLLSELLVLSELELRLLVCRGKAASTPVLRRELKKKELAASWLIFMVTTRWICKWRAHK